MIIYKKSLDLSLYLVLDPSFISTSNYESVLSEALKAGVNVVQLREKNCSNEEFFNLAQKISPFLKNTSIPFIINDRIDIAKKVNADGVHLGQSDTGWEEARRILGEKALIGLSVETPTQAQLAMSWDVDYLGVSSIFPTESKKEIKNHWGLAGLKNLVQTTSKPLVAIGGINTTNAEEVLKTEAHGIAVVSAICSAKNPFDQASQLNSIIQRVKASKGEQNS